MLNIDGIHVGLHKCASTFIQRNILDNHSEIAPILDYRAYTPDIRYAFGEMLNQRASLDIESIKSDFKTLLSSLQKDDPSRRIILSSERLSGCAFSGRSEQAIANDLYTLFGTTDILLILRDPVSYILSLWQYSVQNGMTMSLESFLIDYQSSPCFPTRFHNIFCKVSYIDYVECLQNIFGKNRIHILFLEDLHNAPKAFINSLLPWLKTSNSPSLPEKRTNASLYYTRANILRTTNIFCQGRYNRSPLSFAPPQARKTIHNFLEKIPSLTSNKTKTKSAKNQVRKIISGKKASTTVGMNIMEKLCASNRQLSELMQRDLGKLDWDL